MFQNISGFSASASPSLSAPAASGSALRRASPSDPSQPPQQYDQRWDALFGEGEEDPDKPDDRDTKTSAFVLDATWDSGAKLLVTDASQLISNKDAVIVLIDCCSKMMRPNDAGTIPFEMGLDAAILTLTDKIISSENDLLGVCFYGTKEKKNLNDFEGIYVAQDLDVPDAQRIIDLEALKTRFKKENTCPFGTSETEFPFCDALWTCSTLFSTCPIKVGSRRIFLVTCEDHPNAGNHYLRDQAIQRARDLHELGIDIELFMIHPADRPFDPTHFFQEILAVSEDDDAGVFNMDAASKWEELKTRVRRKVFKKRSLAKLSFSVGPDVEFAVRLYNLTQDTKKGNFVWVDSKTNVQLKTVTKWVCEDTGALLLPSQMKLAFTYGGEKVVFEKEDINMIKTVDQPGIRLMGFKPRSALKVYHNLKHSAFLYPDELAVKGSTTAFAALLDRMLAKDRIAIARLTPRINSPPRFVALLPSKEKYDADNAQQQPGGFFVIPLPYADDIRKISIKSELRPASAEQVVQAKKMVRSLRLPFDSRDFENPVLQKHYAALHALALEKNNVDDVPDMILPDTEGFAKAAPVIQNFRSAVMSEHYDPLAKPPKATKRKLTEPGEKKAKKERSEPLGEICQRGDAHKLTAPELRDFLMTLGVKGSSKLKKQELVDKVNEVLGVAGNQPQRTNSASRLSSADPDDIDDDDE